MNTNLLLRRYDFSTHPLLCPFCSNDSLAYVRTNVFLRYGQSEYSGVRVNFEGSPECNVYAADEIVQGNPSPDRSGLSIQFQCLKCPPGSQLRELVITDNNGRSEMGWRVRPPFNDPCRWTRS